MSTSHNPDNLTPEQVGVADGWRLLDADEIKERQHTTLIQCWNGFLWHDEEVSGSHSNCTYRTKLSRDELAVITLPAPEALTSSIPATEQGVAPKGNPGDSGAGILANGWRPIETAPNYPVIGRFEFPKGSLVWHAKEIYRHQDQWWMPGRDDAPVHPTHWQPLPPASLEPAKATTDAGGLQVTEVDRQDQDMDCFLAAHQAFHGSRNPHTQFEYSAASVITKYRHAAVEAATAGLLRIIGEHADATNKMSIEMFAKERAHEAATKELREIVKELAAMPEHSGDDRGPCLCSHCERVRKARTALQAKGQP